LAGLAPQPSTDSEIIMTSYFTVIATGQSLIHHDLHGIDDLRLRAIEEILKAGDLAFTNFEMTIYGRHAGWPLKGSYFGCAMPVVLLSLKNMGFNALSLANNHAFDLGPSGILSTIEVATNLGFLHAGTGCNRSSANRHAEKVFNGKKVGLVAMDAGPGPAFMYADDKCIARPARPGVNQLKVQRKFDLDELNFEMLRELQKQFGTTELELANYAQPNDPPQVDGMSETNFFGTVFRRSNKTARRTVVDPKSATTQLNAIRKASDSGLFVVAYLHHHHWEPDWRHVPAWVQDFARLCVDAGARIFVSHGAPVLQAIEIYRNAPIFYGLGNFLFHTDHDDTEWSPPEVWKSIIASCRFNSNGDIQMIDLYPIVVGGAETLKNRTIKRLLYPVIAQGSLAREILGELAERSASYGTIVHLGDGHGFIGPAPPVV
jgi:poly-gamma-glutamate synthesis protein (capsule biosynthesis protein)